MFAKTKRNLSMLLAVMLVCTLFSATGAAQSSADDLAGHWAESDMRKWVESGLLTGYEDGTYRPDQKVTRAEFVTLINRSFQLSGEAVIAFSDVSPGNWVYEQIGIAVEAGYIKGYADGTFKPQNGVTREEAAYMVSALLRLEGTPEALIPYDDVSEVSDAGKQVLSALVQAGILKGGSAGKLNPKGGLTRAQAVTVLEAAYAVANPTTTYDQPGVYGPESGKETIVGDVVIAAAGITLQNVNITGDLTVTSGVGEGDAFFKGITVQGETYVQGGGPNSIHFEDSVIVRISVDKRDGSVRLVVAGQSSIQHVVVKSPVKLEESFVTDSGISNVELSDALPSGSQVELLGQFENVDVLSSNIKVKIPSGSIDNLSVQAGASSNDIELSKDVSILKLVLDSVAKLLGEGKIETAVVNNGAKGSEFEKQPEKIEGSGAVAPTPTPAVGNPGPVTTPAPTPVQTDDPEETEGPVATPCSSDACKEASLEELAFGDFVLDQMGSGNTLTGATGFDPEVFNYSIVNDVPAATSIPLTIEKAEYTIVGYGITNSGDNRYQYGVIINDESLIIDVKPNVDLDISLTVRSGDGLRSKNYRVLVHYPRDIQNAFKLMRYNSYDYYSQTWGYDYSLVAEVVNGEPLLDTDIINVYRSEEESNPINPISGAGSYGQVSIPSAELQDNTGAFYIRIFRDETVVYQGEYQYNLSSLEPITADIGFDLLPFTRQELIDEFNNNPNLPTPFSFGFKRMVDIDRLLLSVPNAKYYMFYDEEIGNPRSELPLPLMQDQVKLNTIPIGFNGPMLSSAHMLPIQSSGVISFGSHYYGQSSQTVKDRFYYMILFDENYVPIGYHIAVVQFDEASVAEGFTIEHTWQPEQSE